MPLLSLNTGGVQETALVIDFGVILWFAGQNIICGPRLSAKIYTVILIIIIRKSMKSLSQIRSYERTSA